MGLPTFVDIDGTLTMDGEHGWGKPRESMIEAVKNHIANGVEVVLWSGRGTLYAQQWAEKHGFVCTAVGKPKVCIDDNPEIRPGGLKVIPVINKGES